MYANICQLSIGHHIKIFIIYFPSKDFFWYDIHAFCNKYRPNKVHGLKIFYQRYGNIMNSISNITQTVNIRYLIKNSFDF